MKTMSSTVIFFIMLMLSDVRGLSLLSGNVSAETSQALSEASTTQVTNALREIVNQESLVRFSMVQKIQELMLTVADNKKSIADLRDDVTDLKKTNQELQAKNEGLQLKFEEEITNNQNRFQRVERELTSLSQSVHDIRKIQKETSQDLRNISSSLSTVEKDILQSMKTTTPATIQSSTIAFYAYMSTNMGTINGQKILVFDVVKTNIGGGYLSSSGNFVVPVTGTYVFSWTFRVYEDAYHSTQLMVNGVEYGILHLNTDPGSDVQETGLVVVNVVKGDVVLVRTPESWNKGSIDSNAAGRSSFAGWKL